MPQVQQEATGRRMELYSREAGPRREARGRRRLEVCELARWIESPIERYGEDVREERNSQTTKANYRSFQVREPIKRLIWLRPPVFLSSIAHAL